MSDGDGHEGDGDDGPEVRSQQLFLILLADEDDARGVATLLRDIVTEGREADAAFLVPPVRATAYFTGGPAIEHWRKTIPSVPANGVYICEHDDLLRSVLSAQPGRFLIGVRDPADLRSYSEVPASKARLFVAKGPIGVAAGVAKLFSSELGTLFERADAEKLESLDSDFPFDVEPAEWPDRLRRDTDMSEVNGDGISYEERSRTEIIRRSLEQADIPPPAKDDLLAELRELEENPADGSTGRMMKRLAFLAHLPWQRRASSGMSVSKVAAALDDGHYGMPAAKEAILEYVAVLSRRSRLGLSSVGDAPKLCLVGPPGVGKTTLIRSVARGLDRPMVSMPFSGFVDAESLRGWDRAYIGTGPGAIMKAIDRLGCIDGVIRLDELEKSGRSERGNPSDVLLELLDPEQSRTFRDAFLDVPFDLSEIVFIATANTLDGVDPALRDRLEVVKLRGYTPEEKVVILRDYMLPPMLESHGLDEGSMEIADDVLPLLVDLTGNEPGVRSLDRLVKRILRKAVLRLEKSEAADQTPIRVTVALAKEWTTDYLAPQQLGYAVRSARSLESG